ncbi:MAG TPA: carboxypeptidase-like regulatory domain-containing protein, partial [Bacteroidales bacterium]|nr:carboxypeptidase-like regulatory domain-containing protein [Bacteroidales bacterium]
MKRIYTILFTLFWLDGIAWCQSINITGFVKDSTTQEVLVGATVFDSTGQFFTTTNQYGYFTLEVPSNSTLIVSYVGYRRKFIKTDTCQNILTIPMVSHNEIEPVIVKSDQSAQIHYPLPVVERIQASTLTQLPSLLGDPDITRIVQILPGVNISAENSTGYYVHGGNFDQNLMLVDYIPIYNASHMFGMFSICNVSTFNNAKLYKGAIPAQYGGRTSSVLDISMRNGNKNKYGGEINAGTFSSRILLEGPLVNNKSSFIFTYRRSMLDIEPTFIKNYTIWLTGLDRSFDIIQMDKYKFYDFTMKVNYSLSDKSSLSFSYIGSSDAYPTDKKYLSNAFSYHNQGLSIQWHTIFYPKLSSTIVAYHSQFSNTATLGNKIYFATENQYEGNYLDIESQVSEDALRWLLDWSSEKHRIQGGLQLGQYQINPLLKRFSGVAGIDKTIQQNATNYSIAFFASDEYHISERLTIVPGIRMEYYRFTTQTVYLQPRFFATYKITHRMSGKVSYCRVVQTMQQVNSQSLLTGNVGIWLLSNHSRQPLIGNDYIVALEWGLGKYRANVEGYFKTMHNLIALKEGVSILYDNVSFEQLIETGRGTAKGIEVSIHKDFGNTTGWLGYHLSSAQVQFPQIRESKKFAAPYDRTHTLTAVLSQKITAYLSVGTQWIYTTGIPINLYNAMYYMAELSFTPNNTYLFLNQYTGRQQANTLRFPSYHRLDINMSFNKQYQRWKLEYQIGAFNLYNRTNAYKITQSAEGIRYIGLFKIVPYFSITV